MYFNDRNGSRAQLRIITSRFLKFVLFIQIRRSLQPSKENIQHLTTWNFFFFFYLCGSFLPSWIRIRIRIPNPDKDSLPWLTPDPIRIRNTAYNIVTSRILKFFLFIQKQLNIQWSMYFNDRNGSRAQLCQARAFPAALCWRPWIFPSRGKSPPSCTYTSLNNT